MPPTSVPLHSALLSPRSALITVRFALRAIDLAVDCDRYFSLIYGIRVRFLALVSTFLGASFSCPFFSLQISRSYVCISLVFDSFSGCFHARGNVCEVYT